MNNSVIAKSDAYPCENISTGIYLSSRGSFHVKWASTSQRKVFKMMPPNFKYFFWNVSSSTPTPYFRKGAMRQFCHLTVITVATWDTSLRFGVETVQVLYSIILILDTWHLSYLSNNNGLNLGLPAKRQSLWPSCKPNFSICCISLPPCWEPKGVRSNFPFFIVSWGQKNKRCH